MLRITLLATVLFLVSYPASNLAQGGRHEEYHHLISQLMERENKCLESGDGTAGAPTGMQPCGNFSGQLWKMIPAGGGYYHLQSQFQEAQNKCLESGDMHGTSRMDPCGNFSGQLWQMVPSREHEGYYHLRSQFMEPHDGCLESGDGTAGAPTRMQPCGNFSGQLWKLE